LTAAIYIIATISGFVAPLVTPRLGHRGISQWGFGGAFVSLLAAALFLHLDWKLLVPVAAATLLWSHFILPEVYGYVEHEKLVKLGTSP
jgi:predicted small integral membrane protein